MTKVRVVVLAVLALVITAMPVACWPLLGGDLAPAQDAASENVEPDGRAASLVLSGTSATILRGSSAQVPLTLARSDGFTDDVVVSVGELPAGVTADPMVFANGATSGALTLRATSSATLGVNARLAIQGASGALASPVLYLPLVVQDASGTLDLTFGTGGIATFTLRGAIRSNLGPAGLAIQVDGRIAFCGMVSTDNQSSSLLVGRLIADGQLDSNFPSYGVVTALAPGYRAEVCSSVQVGASGQLTLAGYSTSTTSANNAMFAARTAFTEPFDTTFAGGVGYLSIDNGGVDAKAGALLLQADGKLVLGGYQPYGTSALVRLTPAGLADPTFDPTPTGSATVGVNTYANVGPAINALAALPDGAILAATQATSLQAVRFTSHGALDTTYGTGGIASSQTSAPLSMGAAGIVLQPDGSVVLVGSGASTIEAARFTASGQLDASFGRDGRSSTPIPGSSSISATAVAAMPDGRYVVATSLTSAKPIGVVRFTAAGALDTTFADVGFTGFNSTAAGGTEAIAIDAAGRVVLAASKAGVVSVARFWP